MKVELAKTAGFCFGVQRAVDMVLRIAEEEAAEPLKEPNCPAGYSQSQNSERSKPTLIKEPIFPAGSPSCQNSEQQNPTLLKERRTVYTFGPVVHNESVIRKLSEKGVKVIGSEEELDSLREGIVVIRAHGVPERVYQKIRDRGLVLLDATCPFVQKIQRIVRERTGRGEKVFLAGSVSHPEVQGIIGWARGDVTVISDPENAKSLPDAGDLVPGEQSRDVVLLAQTTFNADNFKQIIAILEKKGYHVHVINTICSATLERQAEAEILAGRSDAMLVIGGSSSSNTKKLFEICKAKCQNTQLIQTVKDLKFNSDEAIRNVGITAGASTPKEIIEEVLTYVRTKF